MRNTFSFYTIKDKLLGTREEFSLEHRFFNSASLFGSITALLGTITNFVLNLSLVLTILTLYFTVIVSIFFYLSRIKKVYKPYIIPFIILSSLTLSIVWFLNAGIQGPVIFIYLLALIIFTIITEGYQRAIVIIGLFINFSLLLILEQRNPHWVTLYQDSDTQFYDLIITLSFSMILIYLSIANLVKNYREEKQISTIQRDELAEKQDQILDSIDYASTIQNALLPSYDDIKEMFQEHFVVYMPRDVVSGDFFWIKKVKNYRLIVAADCTGHGVPGAFMSILGISLLNEIVRRKEINTAHDTLEALRTEIIESLHQNEQYSISKDGMDIALCVINDQDKTIEFAGANNSLYLIRENQLIEFKGTRTPIGISLAERSFESEIIALQDGDKFYMCSDGYIDQFGGENGKKFRTKRFKELLLEFHQIPMFEQGIQIRQNFYRWISDRYSQVDDILVVGFQYQDEK